MKTGVYLNSFSTHGYFYNGEKVTHIPKNCPENEKLFGELTLEKFSELVKAGHLRHLDTKAIRKG
jgi:hypothetical protein